MVCNTSGVFVVLVGLLTFVLYKYSFKARSTTDDLPHDYLVVNELSNVIP